MHEQEEIFMLLGQLFYDNFKLRKLATMFKNQLKEPGKGHGPSDERIVDPEDNIGPR
jgi:hypothetical protein